jgi:hypothetical protein
LGSAVLISALTIIKSGAAYEASKGIIKANAIIQLNGEEELILFFIGSS